MTQGVKYGLYPGTGRNRPLAKPKQPHFVLRYQSSREENKPPPGLKMASATLPKTSVQLVSRCYEVIGMSKTWSTIKELRDKVALHYGREPVQLTFYLPKNKEAAN